MEQTDRLTAENIVSAIFDGTVTTRYDIPPIEKLRNLFRRKADRKSAASTTRPISLGEAMHKLENQGLRIEDSDILRKNFTRFMHDQILHRYGQIYQKGNKIVILRISNNEDWDDRHYLGVRITNPPIDLAREHPALAEMRHEFKAWVQNALDIDTTIFSRQDKPGFVDRISYTRLGHHGYNPFI